MKLLQKRPPGLVGEFLVQHPTCRAWQRTVTPEELPRVVEVRYGNSDTGFWVEDKTEATDCTLTVELIK